MRQHSSRPFVRRPLTVAVVSAVAFVTLGSPGAQATQGRAVKAGESNTATATTEVTTTTGAGVLGRTADPVRAGVWGVGPTHGVQGSALADGGVGVLGSDIGKSEIGIGVFGVSQVGNGVIGQSEEGPGVNAYSRDSFGVIGTSENGTGIVARSRSSTRPALSAQSLSGGPALSAEGTVHLSRSGSVVIPAGEKTSTISVADVTTGTKGFAMVQSAPGGRWVSAIVPDASADQITIYLNRATGPAATVAWFLLD